MRGKGTSASPVGGGGGITPAHAGKSMKSMIALRFCGDHPRTCGEKGEEVPRLTEEKGSPPHMRGKVLPKMVALFFLRITPAHAGKSQE